MYQYKRVDVFHHKDVDKISGVAVSIIIATMMAIWGVAWVDTGNFWGIFVWLGKAFVWITYCFFYGIFTAFF